MKFERIDESKFNCILSNDELSQLNLQLSDLTYGSGAARKLFRNILKQAHEEFDFEVSEQALMIEAIPTEEDGLLLQFSQVPDPDELDSRFSSFAPYLQASSDDEDGDEDFFPSQQSADDIWKELLPSDITTSSKPETAQPDPLSLKSNFEDVLRSLMEFPELFSSGKKPTPPAEASDAAGTDKEDNAQSTAPTKDLQVVFQFHDFDTLCEGAKRISSFQGESALYKRKEAPCYQLVLSSRQVAPQVFNSVCNALSEWGEMCRNNSTLLLPYLEEHASCLIKAQAVSVLANLG